MARPRPISWLRTHPFVGDGALALLVTGLGLVTLFTAETDPDFIAADALAVVLVVAANAPVVLRRRFPVKVLGAVTLAQFAIHVIGYQGDSWLGVIVALYSVGAGLAPSRRRTTALIGFLVAANTLLLTGLLLDQVDIGNVLGSNVTLPAAFILGDNLRRRRERLADLAERAERAEREQELLARERVNEERSRIARELHDVVAHSVSVMVIQAGAARRQLALDPERAATALEAIESTGREAMNEMRRILGVLRTDDVSDRAPQPSLDAIGDLLASDPSLPTRLQVQGDRPNLPAGIELSAYRVVQEALTNVRKHAGPCERVDISVRYRPEAVEIAVRDDGRGAAQANRPTLGHGLVGMRERVAACGGDLRVGPALGGGWKVEARFPVRPAEVGS